MSRILGPDGNPVRPVEAKQSRVFRPPLRSRFDAAQTNADNRNHWAAADALSADSAASPTVRKTLRNRARYEVANSSYAHHIIHALANDAIGSSVRLQMIGTQDRATERNEIRRKKVVAPTPAEAAFVEGEFYEWMQESGLFDHLRTIRVARGVDGEAFMLATDNPLLPTPVTLQYVPFECDLVTGQQTFAQSSPTYVDGIWYDKYGNPSFYDILQNYPNEGYGTYGKFDHVPSDFVLHFFNRQRPGQRRGYSELTPALGLFAIMRRWTIAVLSAAETAANFSLVLETQGEVAEADASQQPFDEIPVVKNMMLTMPQGWQMHQMQAEQPVSTYKEVKREIAGEVAAALDVPVHIALQDSSEHNYSSARLDNQGYVKTRKVDRQRMESQGLDRVFRMWADEAVKVEGYLPQSMRNVNSDWSHRWFWDGDEHMDPVKEAASTKMDLESLSTTYAEVYGKKGQDWEEAFAQIAREKKAMAKLGISPADIAPQVDSDEDQEAIDAAYSLERDDQGRVIQVRASRG